MEGKKPRVNWKKIAYGIVGSKVLVRWLCRLKHVPVRLIVRAGENRMVIVFF